MNEEKILEKYLQKIISPPNNFIVDIGASDGVKMSNTYHLFKNGYSGAAIEANDIKFQQLNSNYSTLSNVKRLNRKVLPHNIQSILESVNTPKDFLLLDLDIDGYDYFVLESILKSFRPIIIITEINESIPPPVKFKVLPNEEFAWKGGHFFGYSIACLDDIKEKFNYSLVELHYNNAILISDHFWNNEVLTTKEAYNMGYWSRPNRRKRFHYNKDFEYLFDMTVKEVVNELQGHFSDHNGQYLIN